MRIALIMHNEIPYTTQIGDGFFGDHAYNITLNSRAILGKNVTIFKGATVGVDNYGVPIIGNNVYIGINAVIVGNITVGDDVLIAANSFVNFDVPSHSVVIGNPGEIHKKENPTRTYLCNVIEV